MPVFLLVLACYWGALIYYMGAQWSFFEEYNYGWAVPFLCLYLLWNRWRGSNAQDLPDAASPVDPRPVSRGLWFAVLLFAALYAPTRLVYEATPMWRLPLFLWVIEVIALTLVLAHLATGWRRVSELAPAILFFLVAMPWPVLIENSVQERLARLNASGAVETLQLLGIPAMPRGNVIELSNGLLGIEKACSGIQSLQASIMLGCFLGVLYRLGATRLVALVLSGAALAFLCNLLRTTTLGCVASRQGIDAATRWHDPAGVLILLCCFAGVWLIANLLKRKRPGTTEPSPASSGVRAQPGSSVKTEAPALWPRFRPIGFALLLCFAVVEAGVEWWYRSHDKPAPAAAQWAVNWPTNNPTFKVADPQPRVRRILRFDHGTNGTWVGSDGSSWQAYFFVWHPARTLYRRVEVSLFHDPEACNKAAGWKLREVLPPVTIPVTPDFSLAFRRMIFENDGRLMHLFVAVDLQGDPAGLAAASFQFTRRDHLRSALCGTRVYGHRALEVGISGMNDPEDATAALRREIKAGLVVRL